MSNLQVIDPSRDLTLDHARKEIIEKITFIHEQTHPSLYDIGLLHDIYVAVNKKWGTQCLTGLEATYLYGYLVGQRAGEGNFKSNVQALEPGKVLTLDSREVAAMVEKRHDNLLRDINTYIEILANSKMRTPDFFISSSYTDAQDKERPCYQVTRKGCEMIAHKMTGEKGVLFTATYINKFHEMEKTLQEPVLYGPSLEMRNLEAKLIDLDEKVNTLIKRIPESLPAPPEPELVRTTQPRKRRREKFSTTQLAAQYNIGVVEFYRLLHTFRFVIPLDGEDAKGWKLAPEYTRDIGVSSRSAAYGYITWTPKGRSLIEETLKHSGIKKH